MTDDFTAARRAYVGAIATGTRPDIAFDLACAAYRARHPALREDEVQAAVARLLADDLPHLVQALDGTPDDPRAA
jgi:hypothetical protein